MNTKAFNQLTNETKKQRLAQENKIYNEVIELIELELDDVFYSQDTINNYLKGKIDGLAQLKIKLSEKMINNSIVYKTLLAEKYLKQKGKKLRRKYISL